LNNNALWSALFFMQSKTLQRDFAVRIELLLALYETFATNAPASNSSTPASASRVIRKVTPLFTGKNAHFWIIFARKQGVRISQGDICP
jgi:hypothetical protein